MSQQDDTERDNIAHSLAELLESKRRVRSAHAFQMLGKRSGSCVCICLMLIADDVGLYPPSISIARLN
jgi:hypothetical protein